MSIESDGKYIDCDKTAPVPALHRPGYGMKRREIPAWMEQRKTIANIQKLKKDFTVRGTMGHHCIQNVLKPFFQDKLQKIKMENKVASLMRKLHTLVSRLNAKILSRRAKLRVLNRIWDRTLANLQDRADKSAKDRKDCQAFTNKVEKIPVVTRYYCMERYLSRCIYKQGLAHF